MNLTEICQILGTNKEDIRSSKRDKDICFNRHLICYFLFMNGIKRPLIAEIVNREWHTVFHSIKVIESFLSVTDSITIEKLDKLHSYSAKTQYCKMVEELKKLGFEIGTLQNVTGSGLNTKEKIVYKRIPHYEKSFVYAYFNDLDTFFFGDSRDAEFFTLSVSSTKQIADLFKSLDYEKYL